jgi:hypothetical protein
MGKIIESDPAAQAKERRRLRRLFRADPPDCPTAPIRRVAVSREEAAASLGLSLDSFERHVQPELRMIRRGRLVLVPVAELERWADAAAERTIP